jgi:N-methylhydantoinase A
VFGELAAAGRDQIARDGIAPSAAVLAFYAHLRYVGQEHTIPIPVGGPGVLTGDLAPLRKAFHAEHAKRYGQSAPDESMEIVSLRLVVTAPRQDSLAERWLEEPWQAEADAIEQSSRDVVFDDPERPLKTRILWRPSLPAGAEIPGPAIIEEPNATTLIHPGDSATITAAGHLLVTIAQENRA